MQWFFSVADLSNELAVDEGDVLLSVRILNGENVT